jgi:hypothetical protein
VQRAKIRRFTTRRPADLLSLGVSATLSARAAWREIAVPWSLLAAAVAGILLGLRFRVPALLAATALIVVVTAVASGFAGLSGWPLLVSVGLSVLTLQAAYLAGLVFSTLWRRTRSRGR